VLSTDLVGQALVPYYRQILPIFNLYITRCVSSCLWGSAVMPAHCVSCHAPAHVNELRAAAPRRRRACCCLNRNKNLGDGIDYAQQQYDCLGELVGDTLALFEQRGGPDAYINIKYMLPTYESCVNYA
jgi:hypothetical protein